MLLTIFTQTAELRLMVRDSKASSSSHSLIKFIVHRLVQIKNPPTLLTSEVVVPSLPNLKSAQGTLEVKYRDDPIFLQDLKVSINCSLADIGYFFLNFFMYQISCRVSFSIPQNPKDCLSLFSLSSFHCLSLLVINPDTDYTRHFGCNVK